MEDIKSEANKIFEDINNFSIRAAEMLGVATNDLIIQDSTCFPDQYMSSKKYRDFCVKAEGPVQYSLLANSYGKHSYRHEGYGLFLFSPQKNKDLQYCRVRLKTLYSGDIVYYFVPKGNYYYLRRHATRMNKLNNKTNNKPVLSKGILDDLISNTIGFLSRAKEIAKYGVKIKRGIILDGPPGNGKTMACRYIQRLCVESNISHGIVTSAEIDKAYQDQKLNDLFRKYTVTFFDDIDISYLNRNKGNGKMACSLLTAMDGMAPDSHTIRIFTTNEEISTLDDAFKRPGRIDKTINFKKPDADLRSQLIKEWPEEIRKGIDADLLIKRSAGFSFAELEAIRGFLVTNKILGDHTWSLEKALSDFEERKVDKEEKPFVGFGKR